MSTFKSVNLCFPSSWTGRSLKSCWTYNLTHFPLFQDFVFSLQRWRFLFHSIFWCFLWHKDGQEHVQNTPEAVESLIQTLITLVLSPCSCCVPCRASRSHLQEVPHLPCSSMAWTTEPKCPADVKGDVLGTPGSLVFCTGRQLALELCVHVCAGVCCRMEAEPHPRVLLPASTMETPSGALHDAINS